jgi:hypothetical protein
VAHLLDSRLPDALRLQGKAESVEPEVNRAGLYCGIAKILVLPASLEEPVEVEQLAAPEGGMVKYYIDTITAHITAYTWETAI